MQTPQSLSAIQQALSAGTLSCTDLVEHYLDRIETTRHLNIYIEVFAEEARRKARELDQKRQAGESTGRLAGMVLSIKDVICYKDHLVTAGSHILSGYRSLFSSTAVERILAEDAIIIGRVNCDEFAMGSTTETSCYGPTRNAADPDYIPGGSSGGSAVAVQAETCLASLGSDTGGSVRQPAAFCGVIGLKPTYGRISRHGLLAYGSSFDQIGILSHNTHDAALLLEIMAGPDDYDGTASRKPVPAYSEQLSFGRPARLAYFREAMEHPGLDPGIKAACEAWIEQARAQGHTVEPVEFPLLEYIIPTYYVLTTAEASSNLSRYDGIRYGYRSPNARNLLETYTRSRTEGFGAEVKRRIMLGAFVLSAGYYDAYYGKAQQARRLIRDATMKILDHYDFIFLPAAPGTAWRLNETVDDPLAMYLADIFTVQANLAGIPAIALPAGVHENGLPIGIQLMGKPFAEGELLGFAEELRS
ncbi:MAG TPA: Asp-tRNA(Asn)/Glu-tRNA(Gln) amidotransferase subunit GatA [Flavilitoribacter sp.]|nr:Asp-tRNA(Asn)/Glu-tRNA(Gln) amidotransferase subunit GatA [Flavilitoribacter sp.]